jgi:hypothetical protein
MSRDEIASIVSTFCDVLAVLRDADPADKAEIYTQLGLRLTYKPSDRLVRTEVHISPAQHWQFESVRGDRPRIPTLLYELQRRDLHLAHEPSDVPDRCLQAKRPMVHACVLPQDPTCLQLLRLAPALEAAVRRRIAG